MAQEILGRFQDLTQYAAVVERNPEKAQKIREEQQKVAQFLEEQGLQEVVRPRVEIARARREEAERKYRRYQDHLAAVAQEALRVSGDEFVHSTKMCVVRSLRDRMAQSDPRLLSHYTDSTLAHHIFDAGSELFLGSVLQPRNTVRFSEMPLGVLIEREGSTHTIASEGWRETLRYAASVLPRDATAFDVGSLFFHYSDVGHNKPIAQRFNAVRALIPRAVA